MIDYQQTAGMLKSIEQYSLHSLIGLSEASIDQSAGSIPD